MSSIHYFQRYSQPENVTTNNTLLLFSRLNGYKPAYFEAFLNELLKVDLSIGVNIEQQKSEAKARIPDGFIQQKSFKIILETKRHPEFDIQQLKGHLACFGSEEKRILMLLSPELPPEASRKKIISECQRECAGVNVCFTTFSLIVQTFSDVLDDGRDYEMLDMIDEYAQYCSETGLFPLWKFNMRVRTAPQSFEFNLKHNLYYDSISRGFTKHAYFGLYDKKSVRAIGKITNIVRANLVDGVLVDVMSDFETPVTEEQKNAILKAIHDAPLTTGDWLESNIRFFLVDCFYETDFAKMTLYPIQKSKNMNLLHELEITEKDFPDSAEEIAKKLNGRVWRT